MDNESFGGCAFIRDAKAALRTGNMTARRFSRVMSLGLALVSLGAGSCSGQIGAPPPEAAGGERPGRDGTGGEPTSPEQERPDAPKCTDNASPATRLMRLTRRQYDQTVADLLGAAPIAAGFAPEGGSTGFDSASDGVLLNDSVADQYVRAARTLSADATKKFARVAPCDLAANGESKCVRTTIERFGRRAFRRPLSEAEVIRYTDFFTRSRSRASYARTMDLLLQAFLLAPQFLYQVQGVDGKATDDGWIALTPNELATRLSFFLWDTAPSEALLDLAASGGLDTPAQVRDQTLAMLKAEQGSRFIRHFVSEWLDLDRLPGLVRGNSFTANKGNEMRTETETYFDDLLRGRNASWQDLLAGPVGGGDAGADRMHRRGFLTLPGLLTLHAFPNESSPIHRGLFIREQLLCEPHIPPPANIDVIVPPPDATTTARQQLETKTQKVSPCRACHERINPPGFAFDGFDQVGQWRDVDRQGRPFDTSGTLLGTDNDGPFNNHLELIERLAGSRTASDCFATQWFRHAMGRLELSDECGLMRLQNVFQASGGDLGALVSAIVTDPEFLNKRVEVSQ